MILFRCSTVDNADTGNCFNKNEPIEGLELANMIRHGEITLFAVVSEFLANIKNIKRKSGIFCRLIISYIRVWVGLFLKTVYFLFSKSGS